MSASEGNQGFRYKARKVFRYLRMYGLARTWAKVRAQRHLARRFSRLPEPGPWTLQTGRLGVGLLGCGNFAYAQIAHFLTRREGPVIVGCMDVDPYRAASLCQDYRAAFHTTDADMVIGDPRVHLVYIASNHASHAEYAIRALEAGKSVHIEKPHVVSMEQLHRLGRAMADHPQGVFLGFNRPHSPLGQRLAAELASETGPLVMSWFVVGHALPESHWYNDPGEGTRVLGNLCHWTDFMLQMVPREQRYPIRIVPARGTHVDRDVSVTLLFADGSLGSLTFTANGETFEGVRERLTVARGDLYAQIEDFRTLRLERGPRRVAVRPWIRDHGHQANILRSFREASSGEAGGRLQATYVWETGELFLKVKEALESNAPVCVQAFDPTRLLEGGA